MIRRRRATDRTMRVVVYGARGYGKTASTALVFGMVRLAGHEIKVIDNLTRRHN